MSLYSKTLKFEDTSDTALDANKAVGCGISSVFRTSINADRKELVIIIIIIIINNEKIKVA